jgi:hypothetical protein
MELEQAKEAAGSHGIELVTLDRMLAPILRQEKAIREQLAAMPFTLGKRSRLELFEQLEAMSCGEASQHECLCLENCLGHLRTRRRGVQADLEYATRVVRQLRDLISNPPKSRKPSLQDKPEQEKLL